MRAVVDDVLPVVDAAALVEAQAPGLRVRVAGRHVVQRVAELEDALEVRALVRLRRAQRPVRQDFAPVPGKAIPSYEEEG